MTQQIAQTAVHKKTNIMYHVISAEPNGKVKLIGQDGTTITSDRGSYNFYTYEGKRLNVQ